MQLKWQKNEGKTKPWDACWAKIRVSLSRWKNRQNEKYSESLFKSTAVCPQWKELFCLHKIYALEIPLWVVIQENKTVRTKQWKLLANALSLVLVNFIIPKPNHIRASQQPLELVLEILTTL